MWHISAYVRSQYVMLNIFLINDALRDPSAANQNANFYHPMYGLQAAVTGTGKCSSPPPQHLFVCLHAVKWSFQKIGRWWGQKAHQPKTTYLSPSAECCCLNSKPWSDIPDFKGNRIWHWWLLFILHPKHLWIIKGVYNPFAHCIIICAEIIHCYTQEIEMDAALIHLCHKTLDCLNRAFSCSQMLKCTHMQARHRHTHTHTLS